MDAEETDGNQCGGRQQQPFGYASVLQQQSLMPEHHPSVVHAVGKKQPDGSRNREHRPPALCRRTSVEERNEPDAGGGQQNVFPQGVDGCSEDLPPETALQEQSQRRQRCSRGHHFGYSTPSGRRLTVWLITKSFDPRR